MAGLGDADGYEGTAVVEVGGSRFDVQVRLRGHFQPIDGRYHWYGRISAHAGVDGALASGTARGVLTTPERSPPGHVAGPQTAQRDRVTGISTPPCRTAAADPDASQGAVPGGTASLPGRVRVAIIGAGLGGIGAGIRLRGAGVTDFVILERAASVGGTWRDNT